MHSQDELYKNLFKALKNLDYNEAQSLISQGADINHKSPQGRSLISIAAETNNISLAEWLNENGLSNYYKNVIFDAIKSKSNDFLSWLLTKEVEVNCLSDQNMTPLMFAALHNNENAVRLLVSSGADVNIQNQYGTTALLIAVDKAPLSMTEFLVESGANSELVNMDGDTPLIICFKYHRVEHALFLLKHSDSKLLNAKNNYGSSAISFLIGENNYCSPPLLEAVIQRDEACHDVDFNVNVYGQRFSSPALMLIKSEKISAFLRIMDNPTVNLSVEDMSGNDIMHYICLYKCLTASLLSTIIKKGYNVKHVKSKDGFIPYYGIINSPIGYSEKVDIVRTIKANDFRNAYVDFNPNVLAYDCLKNRDVELLRILVNEGVVDIASVDNEGNGLIHYLSVMMTDEESVAIKYFQDLIVILKQSLSESNPDDFTEEEWEQDVLLIQQHQDEIDEITREISHAFDDFISLNKERNIDIEKTNSEGETPLMKTVIDGTDFIIEKILCCHANILSKNDYGENALSYAIKNGRIGLFDTLVNKLKDKTALKSLLIDIIYNLSEDERYKAITITGIKTIIDKYPEIKDSLNDKDEDGNPALIIAAALNECHIVDVLLKAGAEVNIQNKLGETALMHAVINKNKDIVSLLLSNKADAEIENHQGQSSIDLADSEIKELMSRF